MHVMVGRHGTPTLTRRGLPRRYAAVACSRRTWNARTISEMPRDNAMSATQIRLGPMPLASLGLPRRALNGGPNERRSVDHAQVLKCVGDHPHVISRGGARFILRNVCFHGQLVLDEYPNEGLRLVADPAHLDVREESGHLLDVGLVPVALHDRAAVLELHENRTDGGILPFAHASPSDQGRGPPEPLCYSGSARLELATFG